MKKEEVMVARMEVWGQMIEFSEVDVLHGKKRIKPFEASINLAAGLRADCGSCISRIYTQTRILFESQKRLSSLLEDGDVCSTDGMALKMLCIFAFPSLSVTIERTEELSVRLGSSRIQSRCMCR